MALASQVDVEAHLGRPLTTQEGQRADALLAEASDLVVGYTRCDFEEPVPPTVARVVASMAARALLAGGMVGGGMVQQQSTGPFSVTVSSAASSGDVWLTAADKIKLRRFRCGGGMTSVHLVGDRYRVEPDEGES